MRILAIRGKNLASLEGEFEIDFTADPLRSAGIFAITGSTGSGKSTLLDALCLALFDDTPRTNRASENNIQIRDVKDKTINQKDSRTILRRGTSDGYAEADFVSLGGDRFRSRWSVRRSRDKIDGTLQSPEFRLTNLTANREEPGRKTELLAKVVELIGLTFDQFTRAVLLAQGDFATFLKATQREKAELLEKLTGTEIYSRISVAIYEKSKEAEHELHIVRERIQGIELLPDEDVEAFTAERQMILQETETVNKAIEIVTGNIKWIAEEAELSAGVKQAEAWLNDARKAIEEAKSRYDYLAQVDSVQEIRDRFNELKTTNKQLAANQTNLAAQEKQQEKNLALLKQATERMAACEKSLLSYTNEFEATEPLIKQARELDIQMAGARTNAEEASREYKQAEEKRKKLETSVKTTQNAIESAKKTLAEIEVWYSRNNRYEAIIPRIDLIINLLEDASVAKKQKIRNETTLADSNRLLDRDRVKLGELTNESERLNRLLPAEIALLRARLEEGAPCPVCGSTHHPADKVSEESLEEAELNRAKKEITAQMAALSGQIEERKNEHIRLESLIGSYSNQLAEAVSKLNTYLGTIPEWETLSEQETLQDTLKTVAGTWSKNESGKARAKEQIAALQAALQVAKEQSAEAAAIYATQEEKEKKATATLENFRKRRMELLEGKSTDEVEAFYIQKRKELSSTLSDLKEEKDDLTALHEKQTGIINQISIDIARLSRRAGSLRKEVDEWLSSGNGGITTGQLSELLSKDNSWVIAEREGLNRLHQNKTTASATLNERKTTHEKHALLKTKPLEGETKESLQAILAGKQETVRQKTLRKTEIDVLFAGNKKGKERIALFEKELKEKSALSENWKKLNEMFGSADGAKFKVLAQGYTLDALLAYANKQLHELSKRYEIQRIPNTLALQVVDLDMLGEVRTVHSLSGGESFLISLALALGLSSLSSNRMKVESLFIDEGFGSLDIETLRVAMDALERLQTQGRKIGVISHVAEMTERINARIEVIKTANGKSRIEITGCG